LGDDWPKASECPKGACEAKDGEGLIYEVVFSFQINEGAGRDGDDPVYECGDEDE